MVNADSLKLFVKNTSFLSVFGSL